MKIPFNRPSIVGSELQNIKSAVEAGHLSGDGKFSKLCERAFEEYLGKGRSFLTHSCTAALEMCAILIDLKPGDEVIMPSFTFVSTANAVVLRGAKPVFVDIAGDTKNLNPDLVREAITPQTKAIFVVHYAGVVAEMEALVQIARDHNLFLIEDAAQAIGSRYQGQLAGTFGDLAAFSFHETKNIVSGQGGMLVVNNESLVSRAEIVHSKGTNRRGFERGEEQFYTWVDVGSSFLTNELTAAFLYEQLLRIDEINQTRMDLWTYYKASISAYSELGQLELPVVPENCSHNAHMFYLLCESQDQRDQLSKSLRAEGVFAPFHYIPLHSSPGGEKYGRVGSTMQRTNDISARLIRLPLFLDLTKEQIEFVVDRVAAYLRQGGVK